jgi:hypothetical protein
MISAAVLEKELRIRKTDFARGALPYALPFALGLAIAWMDSRPHWNDTAITVMSLLIISGFGGLLCRRAWLAALCATLPLAVTLLWLDWTVSLVVLVIGYGAAIAGALLRKAVRR